MVAINRSELRLHLHYDATGRNPKRDTATPASSGQPTAPALRFSDRRGGARCVVRLGRAQRARAADYRRKKGISMSAQGIAKDAHSLKDNFTGTAPGGLATTDKAESVLKTIDESTQQS